MTTPSLLPSDARICIVLLTGLGDVVMGLPVANALKARAPGGSITWVAEPAPAEILRHHPAIDDIVVYEKRRGLAGVLDLRRKLAGRRFDLTLNLNIYFKSIWPTVFSGAPARIGFGRDRARDGVWLTANRHLPPRPRRHTLDMFLEFAEYLGIAAPPIEFGLAPSDAERTAAAEFFAPLADRPVVSLVPASANPRKDWLPERYAALIEHLEHDYGFRTMILAGASDRERKATDEIVARTRGAPIVNVGGSVRNLVWLIAGSSVVIAPDTGPIHAARALQVPVIGMYGHTNPWRVGPYAMYQELWIDRYTERDEAPDPSRFDPKHGRMELITVRDVLDRVDLAVSRYGIGQTQG